jgi:translation elongation factor EF-1alpha
LDAVDSLQLPSRDVSKPLILPICDVIKSQSTGQLAAFGKLETGAIRNGSKVDSSQFFLFRSHHYTCNAMGLVATTRIY